LANWIGKSGRAAKDGVAQQVGVACQQLLQVVKESTLYILLGLGLLGCGQRQG
jgi:hypothetical protein